MPSKTKNSSDKKNKKTIEQIKKEHKAKHEIKNKIKAFCIEEIDNNTDFTSVNKKFLEFLAHQNICNNQNKLKNYSIFKDDTALKEYQKSLQPSNLTISLYVCWYLIEFLVTLIINVIWFCVALFVDAIILSMATASVVGFLFLLAHPECFFLALTSYMENSGDLFHNASYYTYGKKQYTNEKIDEIYNELVKQYENDKTNELVDQDNETNELVDQDNETAFLTNYIKNNPTSFKQQERLFPLTGFSLLDQTLLSLQELIFEIKACLIMRDFSMGI
jgi:hypothetical protein